MNKEGLVLNIEKLDCHYGHIHVLQDINLKVHRGEIVALIGANGAGKTTLMRTISGLKEQNKGEIIFKENRITSYNVCYTKLLRVERL